LANGQFKQQFPSSIAIVEKSTTGFVIKSTGTKNISTRKKIRLKGIPHSIFLNNIFLLYFSQQQSKDLSGHASHFLG
jgi:hypothetical protein